MNKKLRAKANNDFEKDFCKLMNNYVIRNRKTTENVRDLIDIKPVTNNEKRHRFHDLNIIERNASQNI